MGSEHCNGQSLSGSTHLPTHFSQGPLRPDTVVSSGPILTKYHLQLFLGFEIHSEG